jgi:intracellular sulfur oxidation DsrE/DsrF family protein
MRLFFSFSKLSFSSIIVSSILLSSIFSVSSHAFAAELEGFRAGPVIQGYGKHAAVDGLSMDSKHSFKIAFDVGAGADAGEVNRRFDSLARFINMHVAAGIAKENIELALVVHGRASIDLLQSSVYQRVHSADNANQPLLKALMDNGVKVILCGQTAAAYEISESQLIEGARIELSAMTAHALLQQLGYTVNPF